MYDAGKIIPGIVIFVVLATSPLWFAAFSGPATAAPQLVVGTTEKACVEATAYMRSSHMELLSAWRDEVVRGDESTYTASDGKTYDKSLTGTCLSCHTDKAAFCDRCHDYSGVKPNCWSCHVTPPGGQ